MFNMLNNFIILKPYHSIRVWFQAGGECLSKSLPFGRAVLLHGCNASNCNCNRRNPKHARRLAAASPNLVFISAWITPLNPPLFKKRKTRELIGILEVAVLPIGLFVIPSRHKDWTGWNAEISHPRSGFFFLETYPMEYLTNTYSWTG